MKRNNYSVTFNLIFIFIINGYAKGIDFSGSLYTDLSLYHYVQSGKDTSTFSGMSVLELKAENNDKKSFKFKSDLDLYLLYGERSKPYSTAFSIVTSNIPGLDLKSAPIKLDLRELYFALYPSFADITIGRQIINFGKGLVLSPMDVYSTINITDLNFKRSGSDVISLKVPLGTLSGIDLITELPVEQQEHTSALKAFTNFNDFDIDLVAIYRHRSGDAIIGASFKGDLIAGVYGEFAQHFNRNSPNHYFEAMLGADYSLFDNDLIFNVEYNYNQNPLNPDSLSIVSLSNLDRAFFRKHYLFFNTQYAINELLSVSGNLIYNIQDTAIIGTAMIRYNMLQNVYLTGYIRGYHNNINGMSLIKQPNLEYAVRAEVEF